MQIFDAIRDTLEYAKFKDSELRKLLSRVLDITEADLIELDYQPSSLVDVAVLNLTKSLEEVEKMEHPEVIDETKEVTVAILENDAEIIRAYEQLMREKEEEDGDKKPGKVNEEDDEDKKDNSEIEVPVEDGAAKEEKLEEVELVEDDDEKAPE